MQKNTKTQKRVRESGATRAASVVMRTPDTLSSTRINQHARFLRMFLSKARRLFGGCSRRRETANLLRVFGKASAHETERRRDGVLTESRGIASRASPPRAGASPRRAGGTRAVDRGVVRSVARVPLLDRDTRVRGSRSSSSARTRPFVARSEASVDHVVRPAPALELHAQGVRAPAGVPGDGERRRGRGVLGHQRGLEGARVFPSPPRPLAARHASVGKEKPSVRRPSLGGVSV